MADESNRAQSGFLIQGTEAFKVAQALYNTVTGKTEKLSKRFSENYKIELNDIFQLHFKLGQMCAQWNVIESNENITIHHVDDNKETFSSLDRFKVYDQSQTSPIESIVYEFNVLVQLQNTPKPQPYRITVRLGSKAAIYQKARMEIPSSMFIRFFRGGAINVDIDYVDYVVARNMLSTVDSWVSTVAFTQKNKVLNFLQSKSHLFTDVSSFLLLMVSLVTCVSIVSSVLSPDNNNQVLAKFLLITSGFVVSSFILGKAFGGILENAVDSLSEVSYIKINVGDKRVIQAVESSNIRSLIKGALSLVFITIHAVGCSYFSSVLYELLK
ncbi:hypothetical protein [Accumulibacter sp.]|uniref:hypothetical protein n=1 Tax=Accumulibacter sp. TaxID=2053492 RepID=UPI0028C4C3B0|nr:hypothetical protein [Accumulibacter sp.]